MTVSVFGFFLVDLLVESLVGSRHLDERKVKFEVVLERMIDVEERVEFVRIERL